MNKSKEVTIYDIASALQLSPATVSRGLNNHAAISKKTRKKIADCARELGYRSNTFASNLRKQYSKTLGVLAPRLNSHFISTVLSGMEKVANDNGYNLIITQSLEDAAKEINNAHTMFNSRVDGLLASVVYDSESTDAFEQFIQKEIPVIFFDRVIDHDQCTKVIIDNYKAAYQVTTHLIEQGCKNIFHLTGSLHRNVYSERHRGYRDALTDNGIACNEKNTFVADLNEQAGRNLAHTIMNLRKKPDAVFTANDVSAVYCMLELKKHGIRIPEDIAFAGFNNDPLCNVIEPNLTTINYPGFEMGEVAVRSLINHLNGVSDISLTHTIIIKSELIIRESSLKNKTGDTPARK